MSRGLTRPLPQPLHLDQHHRTRFEPQPAAHGEVGQRLVDRLAGGADELGQLLLGEVVMDVDAVVGSAAEPARQVEQRLRDPSGYIGEHQVGDDIAGLAEPGGELVEQGPGDARLILEPAQQLVVAQAHQGAGRDRGGRRRSRTGIEQGQLAEHLSRSQDGQQVLAAVGGGPAELDLAVGDDVEAIPGVAFVEEHVAASDSGLRHRGSQRSGGIVIERREERCLTEHVVVHGSSSWPAQPTRRIPGYGSRVGRSRGSQSDVSPARPGKEYRQSPPDIAATTSSEPPHTLEDVSASSKPIVPLKPPTTLVRRARKMNRVLAETYPDARCELDFETPFQLLIATVLSAQTTDKRVNMVTPILFRRYPDAPALAAAERVGVEEIIQPTGFFRAKTNSILKLSQALCDNFGGEVPGRLKDLVTLPGVGRKTANVVLGNAFGVPGITVDTHFNRLSRRFGWTEETDPDKIEAEVGMLFPRRDWTLLSHHLTWPGRRCCHARRPACGACPLARWCPSFGEGPTDAATATKLLRTEGRA